MSHHVVAIGTFRRPEALGRALESVTSQVRTLVGPDTASVVVVDNDPAETGRETAHRFAVEYHVEPQPGIAAVRNRALSVTSDATTVIFIDDDEVPEPGWLEALLTVYRETTPSAVAGKVLTEFPPHTEEWVLASGAFRRPQRKHRQLMSEAATNNLLLDQATLQRLGLRFDERFGLTGGSDSMFTRSLTASAGTIRWAEDAVVIEQEDPARFTRKWVLMRMFRFGNSASRVTISLAGSAGARIVARIRMIIRGLARIVAGSLRWLYGAVTGSLSHRAKALIRIYRGSGMIAGCFGYAYNEYGKRRQRSGA